MRRCRKAGRRWVRTHEAAAAAAANAAGRSEPSASKYSQSVPVPVGLCDPSPRGLGADSDPVVFADEQQRHRQALIRGVQAALMAPTAVEWFAEASPKLHTVTASSGHGQATPSLRARAIENATPTARGRCDAMVEVCGMMFRSWRPNTLCRPPEIGSAVAATSPSSTSRSGSLPVDLLRAGQEEPTGPVVQQRRIGGSQRRGDRDVALVAGRADRVVALAV